jgi:hypothetical protein
MSDWWLRQFAKLLRKEQASGVNSSTEMRWMVLNFMAFGRRGRRPKFEMEIPESISRFLDDADIRARDQNYGDRQRREALGWLKQHRIG